jgi:hypothetical protein
MLMPEQEQKRKVDPFKLFVVLAILGICFYAIYNLDALIYLFRWMMGD